VDEQALGYVKEKLDQYWSPEIIHERWKREYPHREGISHSTIYRALERGDIKGYSPKTHLIRHAKRKNAKGYRINPDHTIHERPVEANERKQAGHLEGDTLAGAIAKGCLLTLVDRKTRLLYAAKSKSRDSHLIEAAFYKAVSTPPLPTQLKILSITLDHGSEFAQHRQIVMNLNTTIFFADPHSPWQRGSIENINGLLRFFFPKGFNFHCLVDHYLDLLLSLINNPPRKCLGSLSPLEFLSAKCCSCLDILPGRIGG